MKWNIAAWIICSALPIIIAPIVYFCSNFGLSNILAILGVFYLAYVSLRAITRMGPFDIFNYQLSCFISSFRKGAPKRYEDAYEYKEAMKAKRENSKMVWIPIVVTGAILVVLAIIFAIYPI